MLEIGSAYLLAAGTSTGEQITQFVCTTVTSAGHLRARRPGEWFQRGEPGSDRPLTDHGAESAGKDTDAPTVSAPRQ